MDLILLTPHDLIALIARQAKEKRLALNLTQSTLAMRSGVSLGVLKRFEATGKISIGSLLKLALVLDSLTEFGSLFKAKPLESYRTLNEVMKQNQKRKRGRK